jgi:hypothetical protein
VLATRRFFAKRNVACAAYYKGSALAGALQAPL